MEVFTYISCMDTAYVRENPPPKWPYKAQETLHFRYLKFLVIKGGKSYESFVDFGGYSQVGPSRAKV